MRKHWLLSLLIIFVLTTSHAQVSGNSVRFIGKAPEYAGYNIVFYRYTNFIIPETIAVISLAIDKDGAFDFNFPATETFYAYVDLGRFRAYIYLEPGLTYNLVLPPFEPKTEAQKLNPHFQPEEIPLGIANEASGQLNRNIVEFNDDFNYQYNTHAVSLFTSGNVELATKIEKELEEKYTFNHPYFKSHKRYSYLKLWHMTLRRQDRWLINSYFTDNAVEFELPAYWDIFQTLMSGFLPNRFSGTNKQNLAHSLKPNAPFDSIIGILTTDKLFKNPQLAETTLLFTLFQAYYNKSVGETTALSITQSAMTNASSLQTRQMAQQFFVKMSQLRPGTVAPSFTLTNQNGKLKTLDDYAGKFVYLSFVHTKNHGSLRDLQTIQRFEKEFRKELSIVSIVLDEDYDAMDAFMKKNKLLNWDFLHYASSPNVLFDYNIKGVPTYYLIDPEGKLSHSPAPAPDENFRQVFIERYREYQRTELRKNPPRERSIFKW